MIIFNIIGILIFSFFILWPQKNKTKEIDISKKVERILALILGFALLFLLTYKLGSVPNGLHVDEAGLAYDAISLAKHGVDRYLYDFPAYFINFGGGQNALYTYLAAILLKVFDFSITSIRVPAVVLSLLSITCFYFLIRKEKGKLPALISLFLFAILPFSIMHSRWALESYLLFPFLIISMYLLKKAFDTEKIYFYVLSGILFGITLYTYAICYLIIPLFLAILFIIGLVKHQIKWRQVFAFGIPLFFIAIPLLLMLLVNNGFINEIKLGFLSIPKMWFYRGGEFSVGEIINNLNIFQVLFSSDGLIYNAFPKFGTVYYISIPIIFYGLVKVLKRTWLDIKENKLSLDFMMTTLFLAIFMCIMILNGPNINRANAIYVPIIYFLVMGIHSLIQKRPWSIFIILICYLAVFIPFCGEYYQNYANVVKKEPLNIVQQDLVDALNFAETKSKERIYVIDGCQPYIYVLLAKNIDVYDFQKDFERQENAITRVGKYYFSFDTIKENDIYIFTKYDKRSTELEKLDFSKQDFNGIEVYYKEGKK